MSEIRYRERVREVEAVYVTCPEDLPEWVVGEPIGGVVHVSFWAYRYKDDPKDVRFASDERFHEEFEAFR